MKKYITINEMMELYNKGIKICVWGAGYLAKTTCKDVLHKLGVKPFCFCDNNFELYGYEIYDGIKCIDYREMTYKDEEIVWLLNVRFPIQDEIYNQLTGLGYTKIIPLTSLSCSDLIVKKYFPFMNSRIVAYTCITAGYDHIHFPSEELADKYDYVLISDDKPNELCTYKEWININDVCPADINDNTRKNRFCKINAHLIFPHYDRSIYLDGNIQLKKSLDNFCENIPDIGVIMLSETGYIDVYREASHKMAQTVEKADIIYNQIEKYWEDGLPEFSGSWHCGVMIRKHNSLKSRKLMEDWWHEIECHSKRDQFSFPYVLWKNKYSKDDVMTILTEKDNLENNEYLEVFNDHVRKI